MVVFRISYYYIFIKFIPIMGFIFTVAWINALVSINTFKVIIVSNYCNFMTSITDCYHYKVTIINTGCNTAFIDIIVN